VGTRYIVAEADPRGPAGGGLVLLDIEQPMLALALPAVVFGGASQIDELSVGGTPEAPAIGVIAGDEARVYSLHPGALAKLFEAPPVDAALVETDPTAVRNEREGLPTVVLLDSNAFTAALVSETGWPRNLVVSPDGSKVAFRVQGDELDSAEPGDAEIAVASMKPPEGGGGVKLVTLNGLKDHSPRFSVDGKHLAFRTRFEVPRTKWVITAGRIAEL